MFVLQANCPGMQRLRIRLAFLWTKKFFFETVMKLFQFLDHELNSPLPQVHIVALSKIAKIHAWNKLKSNNLQLH